MRRLSHAVVAASGSSALQFLQQHQPKFILLDLDVRDVDGITLLRAIRDNPLTANIPVIVLSVQAGNTVQRDVRMLGISGYISKNSDLAVLSDHLTIFKYLIPTSSPKRLPL
jgi:CheY-like chemotaxis protein